MILSAQSIRKHIRIEPFSERSFFCGMSYGLGSAGYDVRLHLDPAIYHSGEKHMAPGEQALVTIKEWMKIPTNVKGRISDKSSYARQFVAAFNTRADPGFGGFLTIELENRSHSTLVLRDGQPLVEIEFVWLDEHTESPYDGKYQDQPQRPVAAIYENTQTD